VVEPSGVVEQTGGQKKSKQKTITQTEHHLRLLLA
jgi:hypothetical protein